MDHSEKVNRKPNPREDTNILSLLTFFYTGRIFAKGYKKDLEDDDLYEVVPHCRSKKCADKLEKALDARSDKNISIYKILWNLYGIKYVGLGVLNLSWKLIEIILEPEAISKLVGYFQPGQTTISFHDAMYYAGIMIGIRLAHCLYFQNYLVILQTFAMQVGAAFSSMMYRKTLRLSPKALHEISLGNIVTVITKDVPQFGAAIWLFNDLWIALVQTLIICYLIYDKIGWSSTVGVAIILGTIPVQAWCSRLIKILRTKMNKRTDNRLQITQETLSAIRIIKMYTWEKIFEDKVGHTRRKEMNLMMKNAYLKMSLIIVSMLVSKLGFYALIMVYIHYNTNANAQTIFYIMKQFGTLRMAIAISLSMGLSRIAEFVASLSRIENVLNAEELSDYVEKAEDDPQIELRNISLSINKHQILKQVTVKFNVGLTVLTGQLGCGKSAMIKVILKAMPIDIGELRTRGRKSYASQDAWLFPSSIRQNILFGDKYDEDRYKEVVRVCALEYDFKILEKADETILVDRGLNLSKGQQARVNLARAVYKDADIYLIDDALTALDPKVQDHIFKECIQGFLKDKLVVLITHNAKHIESADQVVVLENGAVKFDGKQEQLDKDILEVLAEDPTVEGEEETEKKGEDADEVDEKSKLLEQPSVVKRKQVYHEVKKQGHVDISTYARYFKFGGGFFFVFFIVLMYFSSTFTDGTSTKILSNWINQQEYLLAYKRNNSLPMNSTRGTIKAPLNISLPENVTVSSENFAKDTLVQIEMLKAQSSTTLNIYSVMIISSTVLELIKDYLFLRFAINASIGLHKNMISNLINAAMAFFDNSFIGNILNRFSQDLSVIDEILPLIFNWLISTLFHLFGVIGVIASINWRFLLPSIALAVCLVIMRYLYMPTARSLKRLEAATRSPMVGHLNSTVEGLTTIRAYKAQSILRDEYDKHQDLHISAAFTSLLVKTAFAFYMDILAIIFLCSIIVRFLFFDNDTLAGDVGTTITQAAGLAFITQTVLMQWSETENLMTSVERVLEYTNLKSETTTGVELPDWPRKGKIVYKNVSLTYTNSNERVLKDVSFDVNSKQKIGIVGRTGAGKSTIISTLFRLYDYEGQIFIDDVEIKTLSLRFLRSNISIIPQDPVMFAGTLRSNIDPLIEYTDEEVWKTLHKVHLDASVPNLEIGIDELNFSTGQRQLVCLARAIIRKNKIVVLDEATANMDPETEQLVQKTIIDNFSSCTLFIIAHRLQSILDCHKVMVMEKGRVMEFDDPLILMADKSSMFADMLNNAGLSDLNPEEIRKSH